jgi:FkbM family methyltransferase
MFMMSLEERRAAHRSRGLAGYPIDLPGDIERLSSLVALVERLAGPVPLRLPRFDLVIEVPPEAGPRALYQLTVDDYEMADLELLSRHGRQGDRLMVLGGGIGVTAALGARVTKSPVVVVEANDAFHPIIARQVRLNGGTVEMVHGAVVADVARHPGGQVAFTVAEEFWFSRIGESAASRLVPARSLDDLCEAHEPSLILIDIEGAEADILTRPVPACVRTLVVEIHTPDFGEARTAEVVSSLFADGFRMLDQQALTWVFVR